MQSEMISVTQTILHKGLLILVSFLDDALLLALTQLGVNLPWLHWLGALFLSATILYWSFLISRFLYKTYRVQ